MTEFSELFLVDAESRNAELQRFAAGARGATPASAASAADELADLLRSFGLASHARCARALALGLPKATAQAASDAGAWRRLVTALAAEVADLTDRLRRQAAIADPARFVDSWLVQLDRLRSPDASGLAAAPAPAVPGDAVAEAEAEATVVPLALPLVPDTRAADAEVAEAQRRRTALQQARLLHESLPQTPGPARAPVERVITDLVAQARVSLPALAGWALPSSLSAAPEAFEALAAALATLPRPRALQAWSTASELGLDLAGIDAASPAAHAAAQALADVGGCAEALPDGLRLQVPRDPCRPQVVVWLGAQGWFAVAALQAGATHPAADPTRPAEPAACLWRYELPAARAWSKPPDWQALVCDASGRVMPLLDGADRAGWRSEGST
jgi:hypothetical protein